MPSRIELALVERQPIAAVAAEFGGGDVERDRDLLARKKPARSIARISVSSASSLLSKAGHKPPSSATPCSRPRSAMIVPAAR